MHMEGFWSSGRLQHFRPEPVSLPANKSLQVTFDPLTIFAVAKAVIASSAPELKR